jgi:ABC-type dipeptide/oligopeptide/nickel transport system ATPase component
MGLVASPPGVITGGAVFYKGEDLMSARPTSAAQPAGRRVAYIFQDPLATLHPLYRRRPADRGDPATAASAGTRGGRMPSTC